MLRKNSIIASLMLALFFIAACSPKLQKAIQESSPRSGEVNENEEPEI